ncbi:MAG: hypothetical protein AB8G11_03800 [Saprospiraceae bacterium]
MKYLMTTLILLSCQYIFAQVDWKPNQYHGVPSAEKKVIFFDDFSNENESWKKSDFEKTTTIIEDGECKLSASREEQIIWQDLVMDKDGYDFEVNLSSTKGKEKEPLKIMLKGSKTEMITFDLYPEGNFSINLLKNGATTTIKNKRPSVHIKNDVNKVLVREVNSVLYFFINENFVTSISTPSINGYRFGIIVAPKNPITINYVIMSDLVKSRRNADYTEKNGEILDKEERSRYKMN